MEETNIVRFPDDYRLLGAFYLGAVDTHSKEQAMLDIGVHFSEQRPVFVAKEHPTNFITVVELENQHERIPADLEVAGLARQIVQKVGGLVVLDTMLTHPWAVPSHNQTVIRDAFMRRRQRMLRTAPVRFGQSSL